MYFGEKMLNNPKIKQNQQLKKKALSLLSKAIAKIVIKFRLPRNEFLAMFDEKLVLEAQRLDPQASHVALSIRTGIDRRYISKHLKGEMPRARPDKLSVILEDIRWTAHKHYHSTKIPKLGVFRTFQSICEQRAPGALTYQAILDELIANGSLKDLGNKVEIINIINTVKNSEEDFSQLTAKQVSRTINTLIHNSDREEKKDKLIQRTVYSTQINPNNFPQLHVEFEELIECCYKELTQKLIDYEDDVEVNTYPEYGISFLEYKTEE